MIKIQVEVSGVEREFTFTHIDKDSKILWTGTSQECPVDKIILTEVKGELVDFSSMISSPAITTPNEVIYERFIESLNLIRETESAGVEDNDETEDDEDDKSSDIQPYDPEAIKVRREVFSVFEINRMMKDNIDIDLNPDFQRNLVWDNARKTLLIESILLGIPIPVFYFAENKKGIYHVVDGLQRLTTIKQFLNNDFSLKKPEHLKELNGKYYGEDDSNKKIKNKTLERKYTRRLEKAQLHVNVIESSSPSKVKYDIFKRLNTGGRSLNHQEVRNCIAEPHVRAYLKKLASSKEFIIATGESVSDYRMVAQELVLRFTGFRLERLSKIAYTGVMSSFLDDVIDLLNDLSIEELKVLEKEFLKSMRINYHLFGDYCFRKCLSIHLLPDAKKQYINKALFVSWSIEALALDEDKINQMPVGFLAKKLAEKLDNKTKYFTILTKGKGNKENLKEAAEFAKELINENIK